VPPEPKPVESLTWEKGKDPWVDRLEACQIFGA
jgi:hypothetical protein